MLTLSVQVVIPDMLTTFSTDALDERDRIPFWVDVASKTYYAHQFAVPGNQFSGRIACDNLDDLVLTVCDCDPCFVTRTRRDTSRDGIDDCIFSIRLSGRSTYTHAGRTTLVDRGTVMFHNAGKEHAIEFLEPTKALHVTIPRQLMKARISDVENLQVMSRDTPVVGLVSDFVGSLIHRSGTFDALAQSRLAEQLVDLVALAVGAQGAGLPLSTARASALRRLKIEIERRLSNPGLTPLMAATSAGMSVRYANALLAEEGSSLERFILQRRLEHCRRALEDPLQANRMVGEIAFAWGFSDHSHFTRRFRDAFEMTPSECRRKGQIEIA